MGSSRSGKRWSRKVPEIAAAVVRLARDDRPPDREEIKAVFPEAHPYQIYEGYRIGCLDLILAAKGEPISADTAEGQALIADRIRKLDQWKRAQGQPCSVDSVRFPPVRRVLLDLGRSGVDW